MPAWRWRTCTGTTGSPESSIPCDEQVRLHQRVARHAAEEAQDRDSAEKGGGGARKRIAGEAFWAKVMLAPRREQCGGMTERAGVSRALVEMQTVLTPPPCPARESTSLRPHRAEAAEAGSASRKSFKIVSTSRLT